MVTRDPEQARGFVEALEAYGAEVLLIPTIRFEDPEDTAPLDAAIRELDSFDWVIFTSANAVRFFSNRLRALRAAKVDFLPSLRIAAVGSATAQVAAENGTRVAVTAKEASGSGLAAQLGDTVRGMKILLPRSDRASEDFPAALRARGANVVDVIAYRTRAARISSEALARIRKDRIDVFAFASPSAFHSFADCLGSKALEGLAEVSTLAAIGSTTAGAIRRAGFRCGIEAEEPTTSGFAAAIAAHFQKERTTR